MKIKVIMPMAGRGSRYSIEGWSTPKPFIKIAGRPMFLWALESLRSLPVEEIIFVVLQEHMETYNLTSILAVVQLPFRIITIPDVTDGQLCTVLAAKEFINNESGLLIISSDTLVVGNLNDQINELGQTPGGVISVANLPGEQWSFAKTDFNGRVTEVAEKIRISNHASTGLYYFNPGFEFVRIAEEMIEKNERSRGEFYVIPAYKVFIDQGFNVIISKASAMWDMGTPEAKDRFEKNLEKINDQLQKN